MLRRRRRSFLNRSIHFYCNFFGIMQLFRKREKKRKKKSLFLPFPTAADATGLLGRLRAANIIDAQEKTGGLEERASC